MLDLLSGAFACGVLIFVIFATLMGADAASESGFLRLEASLRYEEESQSLEGLPYLIVRVDPVLVEPDGKNQFAATYRYDEERYPSGAFVGIPPNPNALAAKEDPFSRFARSSLAAGPHLCGVAIDSNGKPNGLSSNVHFRRAAGEYIVTLQVLPTSDSHVPEYADRPVHLSLVAHFSDRGRVKVARLSKQITLEQLVNSPVTSPGNGRTASDAVANMRRIPDRSLADAESGVDVSETDENLIELAPVGSLLGVLQFVVRVGPDD